MLDQTLITRDTDVLGGVPVFTGTRVPIQDLFDYLAAGQSLDEFLDDFPSVQRSQATAVIELSKHVLLTQAA
jgi:uncharacterized protein (DUF433 family)